MDLCGQMAKLVYFPLNKGVNILNTIVGQLADVTQTGQDWGGGGVACGVEMKSVGEYKAELGFITRILNFVLIPFQRCLLA